MFNKVKEKGNLGQYDYLKFEIVYVEMISGLSLIIGPMFAGKTSELIRMVRRYQVVGYTCIVLKPEIDTRYEKKFVSTHDGTKILCEIFSIDKDYSGYDVIAIDEGQFIPNLKEFISDYENARIIISGLSGNYMRDGFESITDLIPLADKIRHLRAICQCGMKASFTRSLTAKNIIDIGGAEKYEACCRDCYNLTNSH